MLCTRENCVLETLIASYKFDSQRMHKVFYGESELIMMRSVTNDDFVSGKIGG